MQIQVYRARQHSKREFDFVLFSIYRFKSNCMWLLRIEVINFIFQLTKYKDEDRCSK